MLISSHTRDIKSFYYDQTVSITIRAISNHEFFSITSRLTSPKSANLDYFKPGLQASLFRFTEAQNVEPLLTAIFEFLSEIFIMFSVSYSLKLRVFPFSSDLVELQIESLSGKLVQQRS